MSTKASPNFIDETNARIPFWRRDGINVCPYLAQLFGKLINELKKMAIKLLACKIRGIALKNQMSFLQKAFSWHYATNAAFNNYRPRNI